MIYKEKIMNKYICTNCANECIVHTMDGEPNFCPYDEHKTPSWKDITERLPEWCGQGVAIYDKIRSDYGIVTDIYGNDCSIRYGGEVVDTNTSYFNENCTKVWYDWVKVGAYCYDINEDAYAKITAVNANTCVLNYIGVNWDVVNSITRSDRYFDEMIYEANPVPYGDAQLIQLVGKVLHRNYANGEVVYHLVTDCENHCFENNMDTYHIKMNGDWFNSDDIMNWYCDDKPCCNFKYYDTETYKWIEHDTMTDTRYNIKNKIDLHKEN